MTLLDQIFDKQANLFVVKTSAKDYETFLTQSSADSKKYERIVIDGANCLTKEKFFDEVSSVLDFPEYFGRNWDAFNDSFTETLWSQEKPLFIIVISKADKLLSQAEEKDLTILLDIMKDSTTEVSDEEELDLAIKIIFVLDDIETSRLFAKMQKMGLTVTEIF